MDLAQIQELIGLAGSAVGLTGKAADSANAVKKLLDGKPGSADPKTVELLNVLATSLTAANMTNVQLSSQLKALLAQIEHEAEFRSKLANYQLVETDYGDMLLQLRSDDNGSEPIHFICPICVENTQKFHFVTGPKNGTGKHCQNCNHYFPFRP